MFADTTLAFRIESAEARLTQEAVCGFQRGGGAERAFTRIIGGGVAAFIRPASPMNKVIGAGLNELLDENALEEIEHLYQERQEPVRFELSTLALAEVGRRLTKRGYRLLGFENVLGRPIEQTLSAKMTDVRIEGVSEANAEKWKQVIVDGFACSDETGIVIDAFTRDVIDQAVGDSMQARGYDRYLAVRDGTIAGAASMRLDSGIALLTGAATLVEHRRRGVQSALLEHRLIEARERGAELAVITTAGGTRSQANAMRKGFSLLYSRAILVLGE